jgi:hypothetical protein
VFACTLLLVCSSTEAQTAATKVAGELVTIHDIPVLRLWGDDYERGYAHGYLLADDIMAFLNSTLFAPQMLPDVVVYSKEILPLVETRFDIDARRTKELDGMLQGIRAARGSKGTRVDRLDRDLTIQDLKAGNSLADWVRLGCSSFTAWGPASADGKTITARNLDYFELEGLRTQHLIIVYRKPGPGAQSWVSIGWPGFAGACTAINEHGITLTMHDSNGLRPTHRGKFVPRTYALRDAIEQAGPGSAIQDIERVLKAEPSLTGNNFHVSGPWHGKRDPAAVLEYDGDVMTNEGVTVRVAADEKSKPLAEVLLCTNHYCNRADPRPCDRFARMKAFFERTLPEGKKVDLDTARKVMQLVGGSGTIHTVVFRPNTREFYVSFADARRHDASRNEPIRFTLAELFGN